ASLNIEAFDVNVPERQIASSGEVRVVVNSGDRKQTRIASARPLQRCTVALDGDLGEDDRCGRRPSDVVGVAVPEAIELKDGPSGKHDRVVPRALLASRGIKMVRVSRIDGTIRFEFRRVDGLL